ncbi:uncharacterized protein C8Q71DRAFT_267264 [Rhodofomes roseus]|uniref:Transmembrane protein n=1 Tax=Rhodofomes roseus TaxID=34475 RepID=A0ABQ8K5N0_9APHY|nr:uncharacterized protein C8Q71DRAFT_267264 [Rhodofomes roseus]KAH9832220.1 hypothetical protein C8Q71DRAFT_267264 [Rhodofomes roseus]
MLPPLIYAAVIVASWIVYESMGPNTLYAGSHDWRFLLTPQASVERWLNVIIRRRIALLAAEEAGDTVQCPLTEDGHNGLLDDIPPDVVPDVPSVVLPDIPPVVLPDVLPVVPPVVLPDVLPNLPLPEPASTAMTYNESLVGLTLALVFVFSVVVYLVHSYMRRRNNTRVDSSRATCQIEFKFDMSGHHPPPTSHATASISVSSNVPSLSLNINTGAQLGGNPPQASSSSSSSARNVPFALGLSNTAFGLPDAVPGLSAAVPHLSAAVPGLSAASPDVSGDFLGSSNRVSDGLLNTLHSLGVPQLATDPAEADLTADSDSTPTDDMLEVADLAPDHTADVASPEPISGLPATEAVPETYVEDETGAVDVESDSSSWVTTSDNLSSGEIGAAPETPGAGDQTGVYLETDSGSWATSNDNFSVFVKADRTSDLVSVDDDAITSPVPSIPSSSSSLVDSPTTSRFHPVLLLPAGRRRVTVPVFPHGLLQESLSASVEDPAHRANGQSPPSTPSADQGESDSWVLRAYMSADRKTADRSARLSLKFPLYRGEAVEYFRRSGQRP